MLRSIPDPHPSRKVFVVEYISKLKSISVYHKALAFSGEGNRN